MATLFITAGGVLVQGFIVKSKLVDKINFSRFAYRTCHRALIQIHSYLRGISFDEKMFLSDLNLLDELVTDMCPPINGMSKKKNMTDYISLNIYVRRD